MRYKHEEYLEYENEAFVEEILDEQNPGYEITEEER